MAAHAINGRVTTVESSDLKIGLAAKNFERSGLSHVNTQLCAEACTVLTGASESSFDLIFLDSDRSAYAEWWSDIKRVLRVGGLLVVDNGTSHSREMEPFVDLVSSDPHFTTCTVPVGNGEFLATRISHHT